MTQDVEWERGTVSPFFFNVWRKKGFPAAFCYLVKREKELGNPHIPIIIKAGMNLVGCVLLVIGVENTKSPLKGLMYALLFSSQGGGSITINDGILPATDPDRAIPLYAECSVCENSDCGGCVMYGTCTCWEADID
jgi:hypothetical protein